MANHPVVIHKQYGVVQTHGTQTPVRIVLHDTEGDSIDGAISAWKGNGYGSQYVVGSDGRIVQTMPDTSISWGTGGNNTGTINIEMVGHANWTNAQWKAHPAQLQAVRNLLSYLTAKYKIPHTLSTSAGISTHAMNSKQFSASEGHWDPGPGFPLSSVLPKGSGEVPATAPTDTSTPGAGAPPPPSPQPTQTADEQKAGFDQELSGDLQNVPQEVAGIPDIATPALSGDPLNNTYSPAGAGSQQSTWQMIANNGPVSPATQYLAELSNYGQ